MKLSKLEKELAKGQVRPAYLLAGEEMLVRDDALHALRSAVLGDGPADFNLERIRGDKTTATALRDAIRTLPVMASRRLVHLEEPDGGRRGSKAVGADLAGVVAETLDQSETVLVVTAAKIDRRSKWVKAFSDPALIVECDPPKGTRAIVSFIGVEAGRQGVELGPGVAELLAERIGPQLLVLRNEIAKASLLAGDGQAVTRGHVMESAGHVAEEPIWDLTDAIGDGRSASAIAMLARMLAAGAPAPVVLGSLAAHFRKLARIRSGGRVAGPPFVVRKLEGQARRYSSARLVACLRAIHRADTELKGGGSLPAGLALERLVLGLAG